MSRIPETGTENASEAIFDIGEFYPQDSIPKKKESAISSFLKRHNMLGDDQEDQQNEDRATSRRQSLRKQKFVENFSPLVANLLVFGTFLLWSKINKRYADVLKISEKQARNITDPLFRLISRYVKFSSQINSNSLDAMALASGIVDYLYTSVTAYLTMREMEKYEDDEDRAGRTEPRKTKAPDDNTVHLFNSGDQPVFQDSNEDGAELREFDIRSLNEKQKRQYSALRSLRARDFEVRARQGL